VILHIFHSVLSGTAGCQAKCSRCLCYILSAVVPQSCADCSIDVTKSGVSSFSHDDSFLGSIGNLMSGSGLFDALELCYRPNAVRHTMAGKHVACTLQSHFLPDAAATATLMKHILPVDDEDSAADYDDPSDIGRLTAAELSAIQSGYHSALDGQIRISFDSIGDILTEMKLLSALEDKLSADFRTTKLWLLYRHHMRMLKMFI